ncbi:MAG: glycoside hydrolase family 2 [Kiritimatiellaeota bacterium]|nr:glycoside hydrolase family 2 [Kiritimatiellota bacterium]
MKTTMLMVVLMAVAAGAAKVETWPEQKKVGAPGLAARQDDDKLPHPANRAAAEKAAKLLKKSIAAEPARLDARADGGWTLAGGWRMAVVSKESKVLEENSPDWLPALVPGTALGTLVANGIYPDPYFGLNNLFIPDTLCRQAYVFKLDFPTPELNGHGATLLFNGVNYSAEFLLNGKKLGVSKGAFIRAAFEVVGLLRPAGRMNRLLVIVAPPPHPGIPHEQSSKDGPGPNGGAMCQDGPTFIACEGWDWVPGIRDRNTGLWQDVVLRPHGAVVLGDPQVVTKLPLPQTTPAAVTISIEAINLSDQQQSGVLTANVEGLEPIKLNVTLAPNEKKLLKLDALSVAQPRLWWPNGYGKPELYGLKLALAGANGKISDQKATRFGIREVTYELSALDPQAKIRRIEFAPTAAGEQMVVDHRHQATVKTKDGFMPSLTAAGTQSPALTAVNDTRTAPFLTVKVNGQRVICKGGNWGMDDGMKRVSRARLEPFIRLHRDAHCTMIRNWCGQSMEEDLFALCDEYGLMVWNEFWISTQDYNMEPADAELFLDNARDCIQRFRNHPSIVLWCARNEGMPPPAINEGLDELIRKHDGTRYYQPTSRNVSLLNSGPWKHTNPADYFTKIGIGFNTEVGLPSMPTLDALRAMMPAEDLWPVSDTWAYHDWHQSGGGDVHAFDADLVKRFGVPGDLADYVRKAQMLHYENHRAAFEGMNARLWQPISGRLLWMTQPAWPSTMWQILSSDYDTAGAYYGVKKACEPVHIQMNLPDGTVAAVNNTLALIEGAKIEATVLGLDGKVLWRKDAFLDMPANEVTAAFKIEWPTTGACFLRLTLCANLGAIGSDNFYWHAAQPEALLKLNDLPPVELKARAKVVGKQVEVTLTNPTTSVALMTHVVLRDAAGQRVLPAYANENYISLLPGEARLLTIESPNLPAAAQLTADGWNIAPLKIAIEPR